MDSTPEPNDIKPANNAKDDFAEQQQKKKKKKYEPAETNNPLMAYLKLYEWFRKTIVKPVQKRSKAFILKTLIDTKDAIESKVDAIVSKVGYGDDTLPKQDANNPQSNSVHTKSFTEHTEKPTLTSKVTNTEPQVTNTEPQVTNTEPQVTNTEPQVTSTRAPLSAFPDTPNPDITKALETANTSNYDSKVTRTLASENAVLNVENASTIGMRL